MLHLTIAKNVCVTKNCKKKPADHIQSNHLNKTPLYHGQFSDKILTIFNHKRLKKTSYING